MQEETLIRSGKGDAPWGHADPKCAVRPEIVAVIPARGGSKGIPCKNIVALCGKPLIAYSIEVALRSRHITRVVVSTDDEAIAEVAVDYGAEVPFLRPQDIAGDRALLHDALNHTLESLAAEGYVADAHAVLYTTHPFRSPRLVDELLDTLLCGYGRVITARPVTPGPDSYLGMDEAGRLKPLALPEAYAGEEGMPFFRPYGLFSASMHSPQPLGDFVHAITDPVSLVDIDTAADLRLARSIIEANLFDFGCA